MILAVLLDGDGRPVCTEMWPGNTADTGSLIPVVDRLRKRFSIRRVCVVADRGMISAETIAELEARGLLYILGVRERTDKLVRELVLDDPAPFVPLVLTKRKKDIEYEAKAVTLAGRRYIVCRNRDGMKKDAAARAAILAALERQLKKGDKNLVGNKGYRRFLATPSDDHFAIDRAKAEEDAKFDGVFVLAHQRRSVAARSDALLQEIVEGGARVPHLQGPVRHAAELSQTRRDHSRPRLVQLPRPVLKKELEDRIAGLAKPAADGDARKRVLAGYSGRSQLVDRDRGRTGRQALSPALDAAPRRLPRPSRRRRRPAAHRAPARRRLIPTSINRNVVPRRFSSADLRFQSMPWQFAV